MKFVKQDDNGEMVVENVMAIGQSPILSISASHIDNTVAVLNESGLYLVPLEVVEKDKQIVFVNVVV